MLLAPLTNGPGQCASVSMSTDGRCQSPGQVVSSTSHSDMTKERSSPGEVPVQHRLHRARSPIPDRRGPAGGEREASKAKDVAVAWAEPRWCSIGGRADPTTMIAGWNCDAIPFRRPTEGDRNFDALPHLARAHFQTNDASSMRIRTISHFSFRTLKRLHEQARTAEDGIHTAYRLSISSWIRTHEY
jgi:hypothetical protein